MRELCANIIRFLHIVLILFVLLVPFTNNVFLIIINLVIIPFLFIHWITNNDVCFLTDIEKKLRNTTKSSQTFIGSLVGPVFKLKNIDDYNRLIVYSISLISLLFSYYKFKKLQNDSI